MKAPKAAPPKRDLTPQQTKVLSALARHMGLSLTEVEAAMAAESKRTTLHALRKSFQEAGLLPADPAAKANP